MIISWKNCFENNWLNLYIYKHFKHYLRVFRISITNNFYAQRVKSYLYIILSDLAEKFRWIDKYKVYNLQRLIVINYNLCCLHQYVLQRKLVCNNISNANIICDRKKRIFNYSCMWRFPFSYKVIVKATYVIKNNW